MHVTAGLQTWPAALVPSEYTRLQTCAWTGAVELSIVLTSDVRMAQLNATWRGKQGPTDVLSFPMDEGAPAEGFPVRLLGDLIISLDTAQRQAAERGSAPSQACLLHDPISCRSRRVCPQGLLLHAAASKHERQGASIHPMHASSFRWSRGLAATARV